MLPAKRGSSANNRGSFLDDINIPKKSTWFKIFLITVIVLAAITVITGILAQMATKGIPPVGVNAAGNLNTIGEVNSYVMIIGGAFFYALGLFTWGCELKREREALKPKPKN